MAHETPPSVQDTTEDDDIVDLLEVVKPGNPTPAKKDFNADLDAVLREFSQSKDPAGQHPGTDQPFPDPTPTDHELDADEELPMPSMEDLNSLLTSLGSAPQAAAPHPAPDIFDDLDANSASAGDLKPQTPDQANEPLVPAQSGVAKALEKALEKASDTPAAAPGTDPGTTARNVSAEAKDATGQSPMRPEGNAGGGSHPADSEDNLPVPLDDLPPEAQPHEKIPSLPNQTVTHKEKARLSLSLTPRAPATAAPAKHDANSEKAQHSTLEEADLNELDALLDDMLASAPASAPASGAPSRTQEKPASLSVAQTPAPGPSSEQKHAAGIPPAIRAECDALHVDMTTLRREFQAMRDKTVLPMQEALHRVEEEARSLRLSLQEQETKISSLLEKFDQQEHIHKPIETSTPGDTETLRTELNALRASFENMQETMQRMQENQEKTAAKTAAKVIREELAALLRDEDTDAG